MILNEIEVIKTSDFTLAATLLCVGFDIIGIDKTNIKRVVFIFKRTSDLEVQLAKYRAGELLVRPQDFTFSQREIKARIYTDEP